MPPKSRHPRRRQVLFALLFAAGGWAVQGDAKNYRSPNVKAAFRQSHACPATGRTKGACPGWIVDHRIALCVGGADAPENMRWQTVEAAKAKDRWECKPGWENRLRNEE